MFTTQSNPEAEKWRIDFFTTLNKQLGEWSDVGDHRRYESVWVSCKLFEYEAMIEVDAPSIGTRLSPKDGHTYEDIRTVPATDAAAEVLNVVIAAVLARPYPPGSSPFRL